MWRATSAIATGTSWSAGGQRLTSGDGAQTEYAVAGYELDVGLTQPHGIRRRWAAVPLGMRAQRSLVPWAGRRAPTSSSGPSVRLSSLWNGPDPRAVPVGLLPLGIGHHHEPASATARAPLRLLEQRRAVAVALRAPLGVGGERPSGVPLRTTASWPKRSRRRGCRKHGDAAPCLDAERASGFARCGVSTRRSRLPLAARTLLPVRRRIGLAPWHLRAGHGQSSGRPRTGAWPVADGSHRVLLDRWEPRANTWSKRSAPSASRTSSASSVSGRRSTGHARTPARWRRPSAAPSSSAARS
jgi:hypothetical protein